MSRRCLMDIDLRTLEIEDSVFSYRNVSFDDYKEIGELDLLTIKDTVEYGGESKEEAIEEMRLTFEGKYGRFVPEASYLVMINNRIIASSIFVISNQEKIPLLAFVMTHNEYQKKGISSFLIKKSINSLVALGHKKAFLAVHKENKPAIFVYEKLDFKMRLKSYLVREKYEICYPNPLNLKIGDKIQLFEKDVPAKWRGWNWCKDSTGNEGWISETYFKRVNEENADIVKDYTAKEISVNENDEVELVFEDCGWAWCKKNDGEEGWLPTEILENK